MSDKIVEKVRTPKELKVVRARDHGRYMVMLCPRDQGELIMFVHPDDASRDYPSDRAQDVELWIGMCVRCTTFWEARHSGVLTGDHECGPVKDLI